MAFLSRSHLQNSETNSPCSRAAQNQRDCGGGTTNQGMLLGSAIMARAEARVGRGGHPMRRRRLGEYDACAAAPVPPAPLGFIVQGGSGSLLLQLLRSSNRPLSFRLSLASFLWLCVRVFRFARTTITLAIANTSVFRNFTRNSLVTERTMVGRTLENIGGRTHADWTRRVLLVVLKINKLPGPRPAITEESA